LFIQKNAMFVRRRQRDYCNDDDYLYLINKRENKNYNYNIKDTPLGVMLDKENIIEKLSKTEKFNKIDKNIIAIIDTKFSRKY
jgi:hypothetical protein